MNITRFSVGLLILLVAALALTANVPASQAFQAATPAETSAAPMAATPEATSPAAAPVLPANALQVTQNATLGNFIADSQGRTLYIFMNDTNNTSNCTGSCAQIWPPFTGQAQAPAAPSAQGTSSAPMEATPSTSMEATPSAQGTSSASMTIDPTLLSTIQRSDGTTQIAYNGHPLYYYSKDVNPGDTNGQGVGGVWFVISPAGAPIQNAGAGAPGGGPATAGTPTSGAAPAATATPY
jgi:predicted lipoprotein with Yx(FWY)xxD motif